MRTRTAFAMLGLLAVVLMASSVFAADRSWDAGGGADQDWSTAANWGGTPSNTEPILGDRTWIASTSSPGYVAYVTQTGEVCGGGASVYGFWVGSFYWNHTAASAYATLNITSGSLSIGSAAGWGAIQVGCGWHSTTNKTAAGTLNQLGGTLSAGSLSIGINSTAASGTYIMSGGELSLSSALYVGSSNSARLPTKALCEIIGNDALINVSQTAVNTRIQHSGVLSYVMDSDGVSAINMVEPTAQLEIYTPVSGVGGATLQFDFAAMTSAASDIVLINNAGTDAIVGAFEYYKVDGSQVYTSATFQDNVSVFKTFADTSYYTLSYVGGTDGNDLVLVAHPIPEPGALALLAAGLVGLLAYAWRKRK